MADCKTTTATSPELNRPLRTEAEARAAIHTPLSKDQQEALGRICGAIEGELAEMADFVSLLGHLYDCHATADDEVGPVFASLGYHAHAHHRALELAHDRLHKYITGDWLWKDRGEEGGAS